MNYPDTYRTLSEHERQATWNKIQGSISFTTEIAPSPYRGNPTYIKKPLLSRDYAVALLCVLFLSGTTSVAAAADQSLPTSTLYAIKLNVTEPLRTLTKTTPEARIDWEIERTERRLDETRQLIETNTLTPEIATAISAHIQQHTEEAQERIADLSQTNTNQSTLLSLSLVEAIEKKQEEIVIASEQSANTLENPTVATNTLSIDANNGTVTATSISDSIPNAEQTEIQSNSILAILATADQAQQNTNTLISSITETAITLAAIQAPSDNTNGTSTEEAPTDQNVITYTLVMNDIHGQIKNLRGLLDLPEIEEISADTTATEVITDIDAAPAVVPQQTAPDNGQDLTNIPLGTQTTTPLALKESDNHVAIVTTVEPGTSFESKTVTTDTQASSPAVITVEPTVLETPTETPVELTAENNLKEIIAIYEKLQSVTQPSPSDINEARTLRKRAEVLISNINKSLRAEATKGIDSSEPENEIKLPDISIESIQLPVYGKNTPVSSRSEATTQSQIPIPSVSTPASEAPTINTLTNPLQ